MLSQAPEDLAWKLIREWADLTEEEVYQRLTNLIRDLRRQGDFTVIEKQLRSLELENERLKELLVEAQKAAQAKMMGHSRVELRLKSIVSGSYGKLFGLDEESRVWCLDPKNGVWAPVPMKIAKSDSSKAFLKTNNSRV